MSLRDRHEYFPFIDWMKALGITLIVVGHVASQLIDWMIPPIYPKQLGVAFFLFVAGFSLAGEKRPATTVVFNRLFDVYVLGLGIAVLMSFLAYVHHRDINESNYLPFLLGANVLFNWFPANPTTWYIGTYLHVLLAWAWLLRRRRVGMPVLGVVLAAEIVARAALIQASGGVLPYMLLTNWMSVLVLGVYFRQRHGNRQLLNPSLAFTALVLFCLAWGPMVRPTVRGNAFPWLEAAHGVHFGSFVISVYVSALYLIYTFLVFQLTLFVPSGRTVRFLSRSTLLVFLAHMPLYYALQPVLRGAGLSYSIRSALLILICLPGLALVSLLVAQLLQPKILRERLSARVLTMRGRALQGAGRLNVG